MTQCPVAIRIPRDLTLAGHSNILECGRPTVPCIRCGADSGMCDLHDEPMCAPCEYIEATAHNSGMLDFEVQP